MACPLEFCFKTNFFEIERANYRVTESRYLRPFKLGTNKFDILINPVTFKSSNVRFVWEVGSSINWLRSGLVGGFGRG